MWSQVAWAAEAGVTIPEAPNMVTVIQAWLHETPLGHWLHAWENVVFALGISVGLAAALLWAVRSPTMIPRRSQNAVEWIVESFEQLFTDVLGSQTRHFLPFLGTLFLYILAMNWAVLIPGLKSPTGGLILRGSEVISGGFITTASLAICVFVYVQYTAIHSHGLLAYLHHLMGAPKNAGEIFVCVLTLAPVTHLLGEFVRPVSLALRLFGNVTGDDILFGVFFMLGVMSLGTFKIPLGLPFQILIVPLVVLFGFIQAMIFTRLTSAYLSLSLAHGEAGEHATPHKGEGGH